MFLYFNIKKKHKNTPYLTKTVKQYGDEQIKHKTRVIEYAYIKLFVTVHLLETFTPV